MKCKQNQFNATLTFYFLFRDTNLIPNCSSQTKAMRSLGSNQQFSVLTQKSCLCLFEANTSQQILHLPLRLSCLMTSLRCLHGIIAPLRFNFPTCLIIVSEGICSVLLNRLSGILMLMFQVPVPQFQADRPTTNVLYVFFFFFLVSLSPVFTNCFKCDGLDRQHAVIASMQSWKTLLVRRKI